MCPRTVDCDEANWLCIAILCHRVASPRSESSPLWEQRVRFWVCGYRSACRSGRDTKGDEWVPCSPAEGQGSSEGITAGCLTADIASGYCGYIVFGSNNTFSTWR